ncbi:ATP-binding protein [Alkalihalobacterium chitinilyticum]|uniref:ATP-binding protein n=1 Tax=Alkalihalobacterium chitinilyticum TaxID=2980103 RepID=UPI0023B0B521|nr:ATP-binding protein [Alkalihalobacterium chitinilyticum]
MKHKDQFFLFSLEVKSDILNAMDFVKRLALGLGFNRKEALHLQLVVEELCTNAFDHTDRCSMKVLKIEKVEDQKGITLTLYTEGELYSLNPPKETDNKGPRGRGLKLILSLVDFAEVKAEGSFIKTQLMKKRSQKH